MAIPASDLFAMRAATSALKAREQQAKGQQEVSLVNNAMTGTALPAGMNSSGAYKQISQMGSDKTGGSPASIWDTGRQKEIAGGRGLADVFNTPGGAMAVSNNLGSNLAVQLARQSMGKFDTNTGPGGSSILGDLGIGQKKTNPYGVSKRERKQEADKNILTRASPIVTYEYEAPTGEYSQGGGLEGRTKGFSTDSNKYGMREGELESGKGKVSILAGTGGNSEELLKTTKAGRS